MSYCNANKCKMDNNCNVLLCNSEFKEQNMRAFLALINQKGKLLLCQTATRYFLPYLIGIPIKLYHSILKCYFWFEKAMPKSYSFVHHCQKGTQLFEKEAKRGNVLKCTSLKKSFFKVVFYTFLFNSLKKAICCERCCMNFSNFTLEFE